MAYEQFADFYDRLMQDVPYKKWLHFTEHIFKTLDIRPKQIVDLGCGTGEITLLLAEAGYDTIGVDMSTNMLMHAEQKASDVQASIQWIHQDIRALQGFENLDVALSYCDVINYIISEADLRSVFTRVYQSLKQDGVFIFDVHALNYVENRLVNHTFTDVLEDMAYIWDCIPGDEVGEMYHEMTFFHGDEHGKYDRFDESHQQKTWDVSFYKTLLKDSGFEKIEIYSDFSTEKENMPAESERIFFVAQKRSG